MPDTAEVRDFDWRVDTPEVRELSHWRDYMGADAYKLHGLRHFALVKLLAAFAGEPEPRRVYEYGVGGGANAVWFTAAATFCGADISHTNAAEALRCWLEAGGDGAAWRWLPQKRRYYDLFLSTATFQHLPSQSDGKLLLEHAHTYLRPNGLALVQISTGPYRPVLRETIWSGAEFTALCGQAGFAVVFSQRAEEPLPRDYVYFGLQKDDAA